MRKVSRMPEQPARAWTKDHDKTGVQLYYLLCATTTPPPGSRGLLGHLAGER
jgi:hypothetical protein